MIVYSETLNAFSKRVSLLGKGILTSEMNFKVPRSRVEYNRILYPIHYVIFSHETMLGYFDSDQYQIGINENLLFLEESKLLDVLRHELAHFACFLKHGASVSDHGKVYKDLCSSFGWNDHVSRAKVSLQEFYETLGREKSKYQKQVDKLLKLSKSDNIYESTLAIKKANELITKYQLESLENSSCHGEEKTFQEELITKKRMDAKLSALYEIIRYFYVCPFFSYKTGGVSLRALGSLEQIELAQYLCHHLEEQFELLWDKEKKSNKLKGLAQKNAFIKGISQGYCAKIEESRKNLSGAQRDLIIQQEQAHLERSQMKFQMRSTWKKSSKDISRAKSRGILAGKGLSITKPLKSENLRKSLS